MTFDSFNEKRNCPPVSWLDPTGPLADAGVRIGDCVRADEQRFDEDTCPALTSSPAAGVLRLHREDGGTFAVVPGDCAAAGFLLPVELFVDGKRRTTKDVPRDTDVVGWLRTQNVQQVSKCRISMSDACTDILNKLVGELPSAMTFRGAGCTTSTRVTCDRRARHLAYLQFSSGTTSMLLLEGELPPEEFKCVARAKQSAWYDCKTVAEREALKARDAGASPWFERFSGTLSSRETQLNREFARENHGVGYREFDRHSCRLVGRTPTRSVSGADGSLPARRLQEDVSRRA